MFCLIQIHLLQQVSNIHCSQWAICSCFKEMEDSMQHYVLNRRNSYGWRSEKSIFHWSINIWYRCITVIFHSNLFVQLFMFDSTQHGNLDRLIMELPRKLTTNCTNKANVKGNYFLLNTIHYWASLSCMPHQCHHSEKKESRQIQWKEFWLTGFNTCKKYQCIQTNGVLEQECGQRPHTLMKHLSIDTYYSDKEKHIS